MLSSTVHTQPVTLRSLVRGLAGRGAGRRRPAAKGGGGGLVETPTRCSPFTAARPSRSRPRSRRDRAEIAPRSRLLNGDAISRSRPRRPALSICAARGLKGVATGDTLLLRPKEGLGAMRLPGVAVPPPVFFCAVEAEAASQQPALDAALAPPRLEDPPFVDAHYRQQQVLSRRSPHSVSRTRRSRSRMTRRPAS